MEDELFPVLLHYMGSIQGGMRNLALDLAKKKLNNASEEPAEHKDEDLTLDDTVKERAKQVIAVLSNPA